MSPAAPHRTTPQPPGRDRQGEPIVIGLVNNMPDAALRTTEWQVRELLARAAVAAGSPGPGVSLRIFSLPEVPRAPAGRDHAARYHEPIAALWQSDLAGLIVTGTEPRAAALEDEPYWPALAGLVDWAEAHTISTVWSCLASHAAAWRLDRIERQPLDRKLSGVFDCDRVGDHPLVAGPARWCVPHSRGNTVPEEALVRAGYRILSRSPQAGVDMFVKEGNSLFVFLQGHPEYDSTALFGEYRRDVRRFLAGERAAYPELPQGYFTAEATAALLAFRERAVSEREIALLQQFPAGLVGGQLTAPWREAAARLYANWLSYLHEQRQQRRGSAAAPVVAGRARHLDPAHA